ncbi:primosomal protein N', partial [bacterium]|nr:primosomal protein N' [bacterium]
GAIMLVPEIALTTHICSRIMGRFGDRAAMLHSGLSLKERAAAWSRIHQGEARVVLGARSAIFAPVKKLGLLVVDEEYESSYKQEDVPRYQARDLAAVRARAMGAVLVMGSATPAMETYFNARSGRYALLTLPERVDKKKLPEIQIVDMSREISPRKGLPLFSRQLLEEMEKRLAAGEQSILFLNRRGYAPLVMCPECRGVITCPDCSVSLVYHRADDNLRCHLCGRTSSPRPVCPQCGAVCLRLSGAGTQRVEEELRTYFPSARILRLDQDTVKKRGEMEKILECFGQGRADILVGTQMVAKGMDFPQVTLVGIISADTALHLPDFRAEERTYQIVVQVAGRAGRGGRPGLVLVQTMNAAHPVMTLARSQNYPEFFEREIEQRRLLNYPPYARLASIICRSRNPQAAWNLAQNVSARLKRAAGPQDTILGPAPSPRERVARETRFQILIKSSSHTSRSRVLGALKGLVLPSGSKMALDVDPQNML